MAWKSRANNSDRWSGFWQHRVFHSVQGKGRAEQSDKHQSSTTPQRSRCARCYPTTLRPGRSGLPHKCHLVPEGWKYGRFYQRRMGTQLRGAASYATHRNLGARNNCWNGKFRLAGSSHRASDARCSVSNRSGSRPNVDSPFADESFCDWALRSKGPYKPALGYAGSRLAEDRYGPERIERRSVYGGKLR